MDNSSGRFQQAGIGDLDHEVAGVTAALRIEGQNLDLILLHLVAGNIGENGSLAGVHLVPGGDLHALAVLHQRLVIQGAEDTLLGVGVQGAQVMLEIKHAVQFSRLTA